MKDGRYIESALRREGLRKADIEVALRQQNANGPEEVAEVTLTPGGAIIVWLRPQNMGARRVDIQTLSDQLDELGRRLSGKLDSLMTSGDPSNGAGSPSRNTSTAAETASEAMQ